MATQHRKTLPATARRVGRPTKLLPEVQRRFLEAVRAGNYYQAACAYAGIGYSTFRQWVARGERGEAPFREFAEALTRAEAECEVRLVAQWQQQVPQDWRAARDFLARRFPDRWLPIERAEHVGAGGGPIEHRHALDLSRLSDQEAETLLALYRKAAQGTTEAPLVSGN